MKLFDVVENGQVKGFNEEVLNLLVKFYMMKPAERTDVQSSPELYNCYSSDSKLRQALDKKFKHLSANRPRHLLKDEMYHWEKIYKVSYFCSITINLVKE